MATAEVPADPVEFIFGARYFSALPGDLVPYKSDLYDDLNSERVFDHYKTCIFSGCLRKFELLVKVYIQVGANPPLANMLTHSLRHYCVIGRSWPSTWDHSTMVMWPWIRISKPRSS